MFSYNTVDIRCHLETSIYTIYYIEHERHAEMLSKQKYVVYHKNNITIACMHKLRLHSLLIFFLISLIDNVNGQSDKNGLYFYFLE